MLTCCCGNSDSAARRTGTECSTAFSQPPSNSLRATFSWSASPRAFSPHSRHRSGSDSFLHICWYWRLQGKENDPYKRVWLSPRDDTEVVKGAPGSDLSSDVGSAIEKSGDLGNVPKTPGLSVLTGRKESHCSLISSRLWKSPVNGKEPEWRT